MIVKKYQFLLINTKIKEGLKMKKTICAIIVALFAYAPAGLAIEGVNLTLGASGQAGLFTATGKEVSTQSTHEDTEIAGVAYSSVFTELNMGRIAIGVDYVPDGLQSDTVESVKHDMTTSSTVSITENSLKVEFQDLTTAYVVVNLTDNFYVKAGMIQVDVLTQENLGTGGSYGDTSLDGTLVGFGYQHDLDVIFVRAEASYLEFDGATVNSSNSDNKASIKNLDGVTAKISIGKTF